MDVELINKHVRWTRSDRKGGDSDLLAIAIRRVSTNYQESAMDLSTIGQGNSTPFPAKSEIAAFYRNGLIAGSEL